MPYQRLYSLPIGGPCYENVWLMNCHVDGILVLLGTQIYVNFFFKFEVYKKLNHGRS